MVRNAFAMEENATSTSYVHWKKELCTKVWIIDVFIENKSFPLKKL